MEITEVKVRKLERENNHIRGIASVKIDDCFVVHGIRILEGNNGLFIAMPSKPRKYKNEEGEEVVGYFDIAHPINQETRQLFENAIIEAYNNLKEDE